MGFFDLDGVRLMLAKPSGEHDHPGATLSFRVDDIESTHETLVARGVSFDKGPHLIADMGEYELWMAFFKYSEANQLALMSEVDEA
jgi:predicted enzyme related to lactoylglutathione lyase